MIANVALPVAVVSSGWGPTAYGAWALVIVQAFLLAGVAVKKGPEWLAEWTASRRQQAEEERLGQNRKDQKEADLSSRVSALEDRMQRQGQALSFLMNSAVTSTSALEAAAPGNPAIKQSRDLIALAASALGDQDPFAKALAKLGGIRGVGE